MHGPVDAVVVGAGVNGLVAAAELAGCGWSVVLVEGNDRLGGFIDSGERTVAGYTHDTFSSWHPEFVSGPAYPVLGERLREHGLVYRNTDGPVAATATGDGRVHVVHRDPERTAASFDVPEDRTRYLRMLTEFRAVAEVAGGFLGFGPRDWRSWRRAGAAALKLRRPGVERWLRDLATSGRSWCRREFTGPEVDRLWVPWLLHAGLSPDHASGGLVLPAMATTIHGCGLPVVEGGANRFVDAFRALLRERGVEILTGATVERILVENGRASGVVTGGRPIRARRAVLASVTPTALYGELLPPGVVSEPVARRARRFRYGRGEMQIHVALSAPPGWVDERLRTVPLIHLSDGSPSTGIACAQAEAGLLPSCPTVVVGQQYLLDPSRVPAGAASLWLQLQETPFAPVGDSAGELAASDGWTSALARQYAQRVLDRVARHAPDLRDKLVAFDAITPADLAALNPNAVAGDPYGGATELDQSLRWRPLPGTGGHRTPVRGLWHIGASTHPGPGLSGASGHVVAQRLLGTPAKRSGGRTARRSIGVPPATPGAGGHGE